MSRAVGVSHQRAAGLGGTARPDTSSATREDPVPVLRRPLEVWVVAAREGRHRQPGVRAGGRAGTGN